MEEVTNWWGPPCERDYVATATHYNERWRYCKSCLEHSVRLDCDGGWEVVFRRGRLVEVTDGAPRPPFPP